MTLTSYFKLLQVAIVLGAVEEETSLAFGTLDEAVGSQKLLHYACLSDARPCAVGVRSVPIVMEHAWVKTHLAGKEEKQSVKMHLVSGSKCCRQKKPKKGNNLMQCLMPTLKKQTKTSKTCKYSTLQRKWGEKGKSKS